MKRITLLVLMLLVYYFICAQNYLSGDVTTSLNLSDTVIVESNVIVSGEGKLNFAPGTVVLFSGYYKLTVFGSGQVTAIGTINDSIIFTSQDTTGFSNYNIVAGAWQGIDIHDLYTDADSSIFHYCKISFAKKLSGYGGALYFESANNLRLSNSLIKRNVNGSYGGGLYLDSPSLIINNTFKSNVGSKGGGIYCEYGFVKNSNIRNNQAEFNGGGILIEDGTIINCNINNNYAQVGGGVRCEMGDIEIINCNINENYASGYGGGIIARFSISYLLIENCKFIGNEASSGGGGSFKGSFESDEIIIITNSEFIDNLAQSAGGGIDADECTITNTLIENNTANHGGGVWTSGCETENCTIRGNSAMSGGGMTALGGLVKNCVVEDNESSGLGGGIVTSEFAVFDSCLIQNNFAELDGGGICAWLDGTFLNCTIHSNHSIIRGGGIYMDLGVSLSHCVISNNHSNGEGGGAFIFDGGRLSNCLIINNSSSISGGGIYTQNLSNYDNCNVINSTICKNSLIGGLNPGAGISANNDGKFINTVLWGNNTPIYTEGPDVDFSYCAIEDTSQINWGNASLNNIISLNPNNNGEEGPGFINPGENNYSLLNNSILINKGNFDTTSLEIPEYDLAGLSRIVSDTIDLGGFEKQITIGIHKSRSKIFDIAPNPVAKSAEIKCQDEIYQLSVLNFSGEILINKFPNNGSYKLDLEALPAGVYFIKVKTISNKISIQKIIKF